jgi:hypothetical protein
MNDEENIQRVVVTDVHMPFWSMVIFMVKWALASIPAIIILTLIAAFVWRVITGLEPKRVVVLEVPSSVPTSAEPTTRGVWRESAGKVFGLAQNAAYCDVFP